MTTESKVPAASMAPPLISGLRSIDAHGLSSFAEHLDLSPIDFMTIDDMLELGQYQQCPALTFILTNMFAAMQAGSVCLLLDPASLPGKFPPDLQPAAQDYLGQFLEAVVKGDYRRLVCPDSNLDSDAFLPLIFVNAPVPRLYFQKYYACEVDLKDRLHAFSGRNGRGLSDSANVTVILEELYSPEGTIRIGPEGPPIVKDPVQMEALMLGLTSRLAIISGGPGTGKTSLMVNLLRGLLRCGISADEILLGAPTGRAAQKMTEAIAGQIATIAGPTAADMKIARLKGVTIHRMLRYDPRRHRFQYNADRLLPVRVVVVDEVSMVDLVMMDHLLKALDSQNTCLVLLGDKHQLPSVEAGSVLADLIPQEDTRNPFKDNLVVLQTVFRSGRALTYLADNINAGKTPSATPVGFDIAMQPENNGWHFVADIEKNPLPNVLHQWVRSRYLNPAESAASSYLDLVRIAAGLSAVELEETEKGRALLAAVFDMAEKSRILTLTRVGPSGCETVNLLIGRLLSRAGCRQSHLRSGANTHLFAGALIIVRKNDYAKELFNGDMGIVLIDSNGTMKIYFKKAALFLGYSTDVLPPFESAFALTVHQSQGSEYDDILLVLPDDIEQRLLTREMLYTAVTRARKRVIIYGRKAIFMRAVSRRIHRQTGMVQ